MSSTSPWSRFTVRPESETPVRIAEFQKLIEEQYGAKDGARGIDGTFVWFVEEVGELARALKNDDRENLHEEFADVFAWLSTLASLSNVRLEEAVAKYSDGCPNCASTPCICAETSRFSAS